MVSGQIWMYFFYIFTLFFAFLLGRILTHWVFWKCFILIEYNLDITNSFMLYLWYTFSLSLRLKSSPPWRKLVLTPECISPPLNTPPYEFGNNNKFVYVDLAEVYKGILSLQSSYQNEHWISRWGSFEFQGNLIWALIPKTLSNISKYSSNTPSNLEMIETDVIFI